MSPSTPFDPKVQPRFTDGIPYLGSYETGLYPGGANAIPELHLREGVRMASGIVPRDVHGGLDSHGGKILAMIIGHSNCKQYHQALIEHAQFHQPELNPRMELLNSAIGGQQLMEISTLDGKVWDQSRELLERPGYSARQVQVLFFHTTYHRARNPERLPPEEFPAYWRAMQQDIGKVLRHCSGLYPNLRVAYLTCDGLRHFTGFEPHVWLEAFGFKWFIESQIRKDPGTEYEGEKRSVPWVQWGPYIWDGTWDESYFKDGVHPSPKALSIFTEKYWKFLSMDPVARKWFWKA